MNMVCRIRNAIALLAAVGLLYPFLASAHCDTMDGPVVAAAKLALDQKDITPVLKWLNKESEPEVRRAFDKTQVVRSQGPAARGLADQYFFETVVRLHRAGEGEPFTGLKPSGAGVDSAIAKADEALKTGSVDSVVKFLSDEANAGIRRRFSLAREKQKHSAESVEAGREYVAAYVDYIHFIESLHQSAEGKSDALVNEHEGELTHSHNKAHE